MSRPGVAGSTRRRRMCAVCRQKVPFTINENGDQVLQVHVGADQRTLPLNERTTCLGIAQLAKEEAR